jgi:hypothetical protein
MATSVVHRIMVHATEATELPTPGPDRGSNYAAAALQGAGWFCVGSIQNGDDGDIDSESVERTNYNEGTSINPPGSQTRQGYVMRKSGVDEFTFTAYDIDAGVFALDSTVAEVAPGSGVYEQQGTQVYRSIAVEIDGLLVDWYPRVLLTITGDTAGYGPGDDAVGKLTFTAKVLDYDGTDGSLGAYVKSGCWRVYKPVPAT